MKTFFLYLSLILVTVSPVLSQTKSDDYITNFVSDDPYLDTSSPSESLAKKESNLLLNIQGVLPEITFNEDPYNHNMHITSDGSHYYTINGGNTADGQINKFSLSGVLIQTYPIQIDGRGLSYNQSDGFFYASVYGGDIVKITNLSTGSFSTIFTAIMQNEQASFDISTDGNTFFDFYQGTLKIHNFSTGTVTSTITGLSYGSGNYGGEASVAVDASHIYTLNATTKTVYIYSPLGTHIQTLNLDSVDNGHSLSIANGYLFVSKDGNYGVGTWYGYNISALTLISETERSKEFNIYPNPTNGIIEVSGDANAIEIYNSFGEKTSSISNLKQQIVNEINLSNSPKGIYFVKIIDEGEIHTIKVVVQ